MLRGQRHSVRISVAGTLRESHVRINLRQLCFRQTDSVAVAGGRERPTDDYSDCPLFSLKFFFFFFLPQIKNTQLPLHLRFFNTHTHQLALLLLALPSIHTSALWTNSSRAKFVEAVPTKCVQAIYFIYPFDKESIENFWKGVSHLKKNKQTTWKVTG